MTKYSVLCKHSYLNCLTISLKRFSWASGKFERYEYLKEDSDWAGLHTSSSFSITLLQVEAA